MIRSLLFSRLSTLHTQLRSRCRHSSLVLLPLGGHFLPLGRQAEEEAERLGPLLENLTNAYLGPSFSGNATAVDRITLDKVKLGREGSWG